MRAGRGVAERGGLYAVNATGPPGRGANWSARTARRRPGSAKIGEGGQPPKSLLYGVFSTRVHGHAYSHGHRRSATRADSAIADLRNRDRDRTRGRHPLRHVGLVPSLPDRRCGRSGAGRTSGARLSTTPPLARRLVRWLCGRGLYPPGARGRPQTGGGGRSGWPRLAGMSRVASLRPTGYPHGSATRSVTSTGRGR